MKDKGNNEWRNRGWMIEMCILSFKQKTCLISKSSLPITIVDLKLYTTCMICSRLKKFFFFSLYLIVYIFLIKEGKLSVKKKNLYLLRYKCCIPETSHIDFFLHLFPVCIVLEQENCDTIWSSYVFFVCTWYCLITLLRNMMALCWYNGMAW